MDEHYIRVRAFAERFDLSESAVYKKIDRGEIKAVRIGATVRILSSEMDRFLHPVQALTDDSASLDDTGPRGLADKVSRFERQAGCTPSEFIAAWRSGRIEDAPETARLAIDALALREALRQPSTS